MPTSGEQPFIALQSNLYMRDCTSDFVPADNCYSKKSLGLCFKFAQWKDDTTEGLKVPLMPR
jgi:hypothetical protein